ncbi:MAG: rhamnulokinase, partial [Lachnospiraceae bacterium]|nr:rhamnulokinase [Lachnospiraceae bacterium]
MDRRYYLAVDIGASSGRHILGYAEDGRIITEEIYRFENGAVKQNGHLVWDMDRLFDEVVNGMKVCAAQGRIPVSMGIDTWGVDYVLLDQDGNRTAPCYSYRDSRTEGMDAEVRKLISDDELYRKTGTQKAIFNTIYQLTAAKLQEPESLENAHILLQVPDYLHYLLTGTALQEYTNATTTQLADPVTKQWNYELISLLGLPERLFGPLSMPGTQVGRLKKEIADIVGFDCTVIQPATHDTASAVMSVPVSQEEDSAADILYISSGTWSLLGCELPEAELGPKAQAANFTNEGGYDHRFRFLKNIMGLWMIQSIRRELNGVEYVEVKGGEATKEALAKLSDSEK